MKISELMSKKEEEMFYHYLRANLGNKNIIEDYLEVSWLNPKSRHLLAMFNNKLTYSKPVNFIHSNDSKTREVNNKLLDSPEYLTLSSTFFDLFKELFLPANYYSFPSLTKEDSEKVDFYNNCKNLFLDVDTFITNRSNRTTSYIINDTKIKLEKGERPFKFFRRLFKALLSLDTQGLFDEKVIFKQLEDFRILHSQIVQSNEVKGELVVSIHPLDYLTMSDNAHGWDSCFSIAGNDVYRTSALGALSSKFLVVAYLKSNSRDYKFDNEFTWNSKKWREIFLVDKNFIIGFPQYPYVHEDLSNEAFNMLLELAERNLKWSYEDSYKEMSGGKLKVQDSFGRTVNYNFETDFMYNDLDSNVAKVFLSTEPYLDECYLEHSFIFGGTVYCPSCGQELIAYEDPDDTLLCVECSEYLICTDCGHSIRPDKAIYDEDENVYCLDCYNNHTFCCESCDTVFDFKEKKIILFNILVLSRIILIIQVQM